MGQRGLFYGWVVLAAAATVIAVAMGALFSLGVFLKPIEDAMRWSRSAISLVALINWVAMGLGSFVWGALSDRIGSRVVAAAGGFVLGLGLVVIPLALFIRNAPGDVGAVALGGRSATQPDYSTAQVLRAPQFLAIALTHFACCAAHSGPIFHMVTHAIEQGVAGMVAATVFGVSGLGSIAGRIGCGLLADRVGAKRTLVAGLALQAVMVASYLFTREAWSFYAVAVVFGVAYGGVMPLYALVTREYFGEKVMGTAYGAVFLISTVGMGLGSFAGGWIHDALGTYAWLYITSTAVGVGAMAL